MVRLRFRLLVCHLCKFLRLSHSGQQPRESRVHPFLIFLPAMNIQDTPLCAQ